MSADKQDVRGTGRPVAGVKRALSSATSAAGRSLWKAFAIAGGIVGLLILAGVGLLFTKPNGPSKPGPIARNAAETAIDSPSSPPITAAQVPSIANPTTWISGPRPVEQKLEILAMPPRLFSEPSGTPNAGPVAIPRRERFRPETTLAPAVPIRIAPFDSADEKP